MRRDVILAWADDAYAMGSQLAALTGLYGPQLEENLALGSFAQDHLGHARTLYLLIEPDDAAVDRLLFERDPGGYRTSLLAGSWRPFDWAFVCARGLCYALADHVRSSAVAREGGEHAGLARTIARDTAVHVVHWREWITTMVSSGEAARVQPVLAELAEMTGEFFSERDWRGETDTMLEQWSSDLNAACAQAGLSMPAVAPSDLRAAAGTLRERGLAGREGRHDAAFRALVAEAASVYRAYPGATLA
jgi:1,2-phenylacetyl-CoA epoxidase catalytic subunit